ncbi:LysM peptidoglycan-binding domain-containing protein [Palleronia abyssalis]|uniref:LysM peptidoglycan-binding domain-containing protein n=1 Tax=Palleronia abyssalis TaxID=1501240 RepID=UPI0015E8262A|nr:LysM peptidoglycan-binding domain-containing protein [Palleronia abyssalis]
MTGIFFFSAISLMTTPATLMAQDLECDSVYTTQSGDSLSRISRRAYGRDTAYQQIFDYNPGVLSNPSSLPVGIQLYIPCEAKQVVDGTSSRPSLPDLISAQDDGIKILTGEDYPPYVDQGLRQGGYSYELVERAMQYGDQPADYRIDVIPAWGSHLQPLIADGAYDIGFPWFRPDCDQMDKLGEASQWRCKNLLWSENLHDVVVTFYARSGAAAAISSPGDAMGKKICRPRGYFTHDLEVMGLTPPDIVRVAGDSPTDCFERLASGEVDLVTVNADTSDRIISELGIRDQVAEVINLATVQSLHAVGLKANPQSRINLLRINKGLIGMRDDGTFQDVSEAHLSGS